MSPKALDPRHHNTEWSHAKGLLAATNPCEAGPQGALIPDAEQDNDRIAVIYDRGDAPPEITVKQVSGSVHTVFANGIAVAVVASYGTPAPNASDVLLVERTVTRNQGANGRPDINALRTLPDVFPERPEHPL